jgi:hypothetical protein
VKQPAPLVYSVSRQLVLLTPARLLLGLVALGGALAVAKRDGPVGLAFAVGVFGAAFLLASDRRFARRRLDEPPPLPDDARTVPPLKAAFAGLFPSTAGVTGLAAISLAFQPVLAGLLAGVVGGMAVATGASLVSVLGTERRARCRLYVERGPGRVFVAPAGHTIPA